MKNKNGFHLGKMILKPYSPGLLQADFIGFLTIFTHGVRLRFRCFRLFSNLETKVPVTTNSSGLNCSSVMTLNSLAFPDCFVLMDKSRFSQRKK